MNRSVDERIAEVWSRIHNIVDRRKNKDTAEVLWQTISPMLATIVSLEKEKHQELETENARLRQWVNDLQSGQYVNCVYCGHQYGPREGTPVAMADVLKEHIEQCPEHPLSHARKRIAALETNIKDFIEHLESHDEHWFDQEDHPLEDAYELLGMDKP